METQWSWSSGVLLHGTSVSVGAAATPFDRASAPGDGGASSATSSYRAASKRRVRSRYSKVKPGQRVVFLPSRVVYQALHPPVLQTVFAIRGRRRSLWRR